MKTGLVGLALWVALFGGVEAHAAGRATEVRGTVQQWAPGSRVVNVSGKTYTLSPGMQVLDRHAKLLKATDVRPGIPVQLMIVGSEVTYVVVNPGVAPAMDQPVR